MKTLRKIHLALGIAFTMASVAGASLSHSIGVVDADSFTFSYTGESLIPFVSSFTWLSGQSETLAYAEDETSVQQIDSLTPWSDEEAYIPNHTAWVPGAWSEVEATENEVGTESAVFGYGEGFLGRIFGECVQKRKLQGKRCRYIDSQC